MNSINYPYIVGWAITNKCNLHCKHCNMSSGHALESELTTEEACSIIDDLAANNVWNICFTGGEPLTRRDFFDISNYAISKGLLVCVTTNGILVNREMIERELFKFNAVRISLDGKDANSNFFTRQSKSAYDKAINAIRILCEEGCNTIVSTCVSKRNIDDLDEMAKIISDLGVKRWTMPLFFPSGRGTQIADIALSPEEVRSFIIKISRFKELYGLQVSFDYPYAIAIPEGELQKQSIDYGSCAAGITQIMIFANGDVSPCFAISKSCGNLRKKTLSEIWNNDKMFISFRNKSLIEGKCATCGFLNQCGGGCRAVPFIQNGNYLGEDTVCWVK